MKRVTSRQNPLVARCRAIASGDDRSQVLLDGPHLVAEALDAGFDIRQLIVVSGALDRADLAALVTRAGNSGIDTTSVTPAVMAAISPVRTPSGVVAIATRPQHTASEVYGAHAPFVVVACDIQDPGNLGAIVRVAEAAGASGVVAAGASADPYGWKALRGSMGSALRLPVLVRQEIGDAIAEARQQRCRLVATTPRDGTPLFEADLAGPVAVLIGGEGSGLPPSVLELADVRASIPMEAPVESLNAATTAAVLVYEALRQRMLATAGNR